MPPPKAHNERDDMNRSRRLEAHRTLDRMLEAMMEEDFDGTATLDLTAKKGQVGRVVHTVRRFGEE